MRQALRVAAIVLAGAVLPAAAASAPTVELLVNGGFETGNFSAWTVTQGLDNVSVRFTPRPVPEPPGVLLLAALGLVATAGLARTCRQKGGPAMRLRLLPSILALGLAGLVIGLDAAPVHAHAGNTDANVIHACIGTYGGVRVVGPGGSCSSTETAKHWPDLSRLAGLEASLGVRAIQAFLESGPFTVPEGVTRLIVEAWGGAGGGGGSFADFSLRLCGAEGGGGGAGGFVRGVVEVNPGAVYEVVIGAGGAGGLGGFLVTDGGAGGSTIFGLPGAPPLVRADGGLGGEGAEVIGTGARPGPGGAGGSGVLAGTGFVIPGQPGATGFRGRLDPARFECESEPLGSPLGQGGEPAPGTRAPTAGVGGNANYPGSGSPGGSGFLVIQW